MHAASVHARENIHHRCIHAYKKIYSSSQEFAYITIVPVCVSYMVDILGIYLQCYRLATSDATPLTKASSVVSRFFGYSGGIL